MTVTMPLFLLNVDSLSFTHCATKKRQLRYPINSKFSTGLFLITGTYIYCHRQGQWEEGTMEIYCYSSWL